MRSGGPRDLAPEVGACIDRVLAAAGLEGDARRDVLADLRAHFEDGLAAGRSAADLLERFGDPEAAGRRIREVWGRTGRERPRRRRMGWGRWMGEVRQAARTLRRSGAVSAMVVATLALGIGANTAVFTALDAVLLQDLPYPDADRLVRVYEREGDVGFNYLRGPVIQAYREWDDVFTDLGALYTYREVGGDLTGGDLPERVVVSSADAGLFATLGVPPLLGRTFRPEESLGSPDGFNAETGSAVAVLSHALWQRRFSGAADVIGRAIEIDGVRREIIGVMPQGFTNPVGSQPDVWVPQNLREGDRNSWGNYYLTSVARLQPGLTVQAARARLAAHADALARVRPEIGDWRPAILPLQEDLVGESRRTMLWVLAGAVALVLLSTCVNAGNLIFARALARSRELAVRGALGANRARLFVHLLLESALLAVGGGVAGLLLGWGALKGLMRVAPEALPALTRPTLSPRILLLGFAVTGVALLLSGLVPALRLSRTPPAEALRSGGRGGTESRRLRSVRSGLVITQLAVALALVVGAGLLVRSFASLRQVELGFQPEGVLTFEVHLPSTRYPEGADRVRFHRTLEQQVAALPGVHAVGATSWLPVNGRYNIWGLSTDPGDLENDDGWSQADVRIIAGDYFDAAGIRVLRGAQAADVDMEGASNVLWI
ncbi:MAG: ABC transporter permease, partial [Gemmatimonadetes bacterium]|nr:ABC transporter permease [Gemmatimonadota bacterium]